MQHSLSPANRPLLWHVSLAGVQAVTVSDVVPAASRQGARPTGSSERALKGAALAAATGFAGASGALAEYIDPDDVSDCYICTCHFFNSCPYVHSG